MTSEQIKDPVAGISEDMPSDILNKAAEAIEAMPDRAPFKADVLAAISMAVFDERKRCASVAKIATMMTGAPLEEMGDEVASAVLSQPETRKFWMVYGHGQRAPAYLHTSKQAAQDEAQRLAALHPGIMFAVLAAVDAYLTETPAIQRFKIVKPDPVVDYDDGIPF